MRPMVAVRIPEVDDMLQKAQEKVDVIKRVKERTGGLRPIDEVVFAQMYRHTTQNGSILMKGKQWAT